MWGKQRSNEQRASEEVWANARRAHPIERNETNLVHSFRKLCKLHDIRPIPDIRFRNEVESYFEMEREIIGGRGIPSKNGIVIYDESMRSMEPRLQFAFAAYMLAEHIIRKLPESEVTPQLRSILTAQLVGNKEDVIEMAHFVFGEKHSVQHEKPDADILHRAGIAPRAGLNRLDELTHAEQTKYYDALLKDAYENPGIQPETITEYGDRMTDARARAMAWEVNLPPAKEKPAKVPTIPKGALDYHTLTEALQGLNPNNLAELTEAVSKTSGRGR